jgi:hypothetical protein
MEQRDDLGGGEFNPVFKVSKGMTQELCGGGLGYFHRSPANRKRRS